MQLVKPYVGTIFTFIYNNFIKSEINNSNAGSIDSATISLIANCLHQLAFDLTTLNEYIGRHDMQEPLEYKMAVKLFFNGPCARSVISAFSQDEFNQSDLLLLIKSFLSCAPAKETWFTDELMDSYQQSLSGVDISKHAFIQGLCESCKNKPDRLLTLIKLAIAVRESFKLKTTAWRSDDGQLLDFTEVMGAGLNFVAEPLVATLPAAIFSGKNLDQEVQNLFDGAGAAVSETKL